MTSITLSSVFHQADGSDLLYRGWILTEEFTADFTMSSARGYSLVSSAANYAEVTYFPNYYPKIHDFSPAAAWTDTADAYLAWTVARKLGVVDPKNWTVE